MSVRPVPERSALLLVGHGASRPDPRVANYAARRAAAIARRGIFDAVEHGFLIEPPFAGEILASLRAPTVFVVPFAANSGKFATLLLPQALKLDGPVTERQADGVRQRILLCAPAGNHPRAARLIQRSVERVATVGGIEPAAAGVILVGHGSPHVPEPARETDVLAATLRAQGTFAAVATAYLEQAPLLRDWPRLIDTEATVVYPLLMGRGAHPLADVPDGLGIPPADRRRRGPHRLAGRRIWVAPPLGAEPGLAGCILERVREAARPASDG